MSTIATLLIWLSFAVLGYGVGRFHEQVIASRPKTDLATEEYLWWKAMGSENRDRRAKGLPCLHRWLETPIDPPGYRAPCMWCDELKPLEKEPKP